MELIFFHPGLLNGDTLLSEEESWHAMKVLRLRQGAEITLVDGHGNIAEARIEGQAGKSCLLGEIKLGDARKQELPSIHIAMAPPKQIERFEFFLEKATEIGLSRITPIFCFNSERLQVRTDRLQKILVAAMKQSQRAFLPVLEPPADFGVFMKQQVPGVKAVAHCRESERRTLASLAGKPGPYTILIGPEGDFTREEIETAFAAGYLPVSLGENRLRTETAGIVAVHTIKLEVSGKE